MADYDLDALRDAVDSTRRAPLVLGGNPYQDAADVQSYSAKLDRLRKDLLTAARSGLLDDAAPGRAVRAAAGNGANEIVLVMGRAMADMEDERLNNLHLVHAQAAARALVAMQEKADA